MQAHPQTPYVRRPYVPIELPESLRGSRPKQYKHLVYTLACLYFTLESCILKIVGHIYDGNFCPFYIFSKNLNNPFLGNDHVYKWFQTWAYFRGIVIASVLLLFCLMSRSFGSTLRQVYFNMSCVILIGVDAVLSVVLFLCVDGTANPMTLLEAFYGVKIIIWLSLIFPTYLVGKYVFDRRHGYQQIP